MITRKTKLILLVLIATLLMAGALFGQNVITKRLIGTQDINWWDGSATKTFTATTQTGETITLNKLGTEVDCLITAGLGQVRTNATISTALTAIGSNNATLFIAPGTWTIAADLTIPANVNFKIAKGAILTISTGKTLTINGTLECGLYQIYSCTGTGKVVYGTSTAKEVYPENWGAKNDGSTISTAQLQAAAICAGTAKIPLKINGGSGFKTADTLVITSNVNGDGFLSSITQTVEEKNVMEAATDNLTISNVRLIGTNTTTELVDGTKNNCFYASNCKHITIQNCYLTKAKYSGVLLIEVNDFKILNNWFYENSNYTPTPPATGSGDSDIRTYSNATVRRGIISGNHCISNNNVGIYVDAIGYDKDILINNNIVVACAADGTEVSAGSLVRRHAISMNYTGNSAKDSDKITASNNVCKNTRFTGIYGVAASSTCGPFIVSGNQVSGIGKTLETSRDLQGAITFIHAIRPQISNNVVSDCAYASGLNLQDVDSPTVIGNKFYLIGTTSDTDAYGAYCQGVKKGKFIGNEFINSKYIDMIFADNSGTYTGSGGNILSANTFQRNVIGRSVLITYQSAVNNVDILEANNFYGVDNTSTDDKGIENSSVAPQRMMVRNNTFTGNYYGVFFNTNLYGRDFGFTADGNHFRNCYYGVAASSDGDSSATVVLSGNTYDNTVYPIGTVNAAVWAGVNLSGRVIVSGSAAPTKGTWMIGDQIIRTDATASQSEGWVCTSSGTFGTASDSGSTHSGTGSITGLSSTADFHVGEYVSVSAGFSGTGPFKVMSIDSLTALTVDAAATSSTSANVTTPDPVFKTKANLGS